MLAESQEVRMSKMMLSPRRQSDLAAAEAAQAQVSTGHEISAKISVDPLFLVSLMHSDGWQFKDTSQCVVISSLICIVMQTNQCFRAPLVQAHEIALS